MFPATGKRASVAVAVPQHATCESVCESIAAELDVEEARVVLRKTDDGETRSCVVHRLGNALGDTFTNDCLALL